MTTPNPKLESVLQILDGLKKTVEGTILHSLIARGLRKFGDTGVEAAFLAFAAKLLDRYLDNSEADPSTRVRVKVIQMRLRPYLFADLAEPEPPDARVSAAPQTTVPAAAPAVPAATVQPPVDTAPRADSPPAAAAASEPARPELPRAARKPAYEAHVTPAPARAGAVERAAPAPTAIHAPEPARAPSAPVPATPVADTPAADAVAPPATDTLEQLAPAVGHTESAPGMTETLPEQLARETATSMVHGQELDEVLRTSLVAMGKRGTVANRDELKQQLTRGIEEMLQENRQLEQQLANTSQELQSLTEDRRQLALALERARKHSLTDELTGLPNRAAFMRQLNAEIGRARRYGFSLAFALIDVDNLKEINNTYGEPAGDAVLNTYASEIMTQFRGYDLVARYGGDEFAVLMPNTQKDGAARAVEKAQKRVNGTYIQFDGRSVPLPSFSSVLTLYSHGEAPAALLQRADEALSHAKQRGRAQTVVALPTL